MLAGNLESGMERTGGDPQVLLPPTLGT